jgi:hypothetical protein
MHLRHVDHSIVSTLTTGPASVPGASASALVAYSAGGYLPPAMQASLLMTIARSRSDRDHSRSLSSTLASRWHNIIGVRDHLKTRAR